MVLVGTFTVRDPSAPVWFDDQSLAQVGIGGTPDAPLAFATGLVAPAAYPDLLALGLPERYRWRMLVDPARFDAGEPRHARRRPPQAPAALRGDGRAAGRHGPANRPPAATSSAMSSSARRHATVLSLAALGPLIVAAGALGLIGILVVRRRRPALALARGRGASGAQLMATQLWEGLLDHDPGGADRPRAWRSWSSPPGPAACRRSGRSWWRSVRP